MRQVPGGPFALLFGLGLALVLAELPARAVVAAWIPELAAYNEAEPGLHRVSDEPELGYELVPGASKDSDDPDRRISINDAGFRGTLRPEQREPGVLRLLAFGGSNTFGPGAGDEQTWPAQLERILASTGPVEVWNLGVSGYETHQKVAQMRHWVARAKPDAVLVQLHNMGPRYLLEGQDPLEQLRRNPCQMTDWMRIPGGCRGARLLLGSPLQSPLVPVLAKARHDQRLSYDRLPRDAVLLPTWRSGLAALKRAADELEVPTIVLVPPPGLARESEAAREPLDELGLPVIDLGRAGPQLESTWMEIHPDRHTYAAYARVREVRLRALLGLPDKP